MTKKVNTGGVNTLATALQNAGVAASDIVVTSAPAAVDAQQQQQQQPAPATPTSAATAPNPPAPAPTNPTSAAAAITASAQIDSEIAAVKVVWEHAKSAGVSKEQFLKLLELDPPKLAFVQQHKKQVFGSKKNALAEAAQAVINANIIASGGGQEKVKKPKKDKQSEWDRAACSKKEFKRVKAAHAHPDRIHYIDGRAVFI